MSEERPIDLRIAGDLLAFPPPNEIGSLASGWGLTKRELFAAMAMGNLTKAYTEPGIPDQKEITDTVQTAVLLADALLKELAK